MMVESYEKGVLNLWKDYIYLEKILRLTPTTLDAITMIVL